MSVYLDCAATTPVDPRVAQIVARYVVEEYGNAGSRTHGFGQRAKRAVEKARDQVAAAVGASRSEIVFTSGATESNNLALLGLAVHGMETGRRHIVSTQIEHAAVLEPLAELGRRGFEITLVAPTAGGWVDAAAVRAAVRPDTLLVSVMHVNNETGVIQPLEQIAADLGDHPAFFHVDAAQGMVTAAPALRHKRIDLLSISGHKLYAPKGIGALLVRKRHGKRPPLTPLFFGGGQELALRPGTLPVHLVAALGLAAELSVAEAEPRAAANRAYRAAVLAGLAPLGAQTNGDQERVAAHILNVSLPGRDAEEVAEQLADLIAVSTGAACTVAAKTCSHVLTAMGVDDRRLHGALRLSWCHMTPAADWGQVVARVKGLESSL